MPQKRIPHDAFDFYFGLGPERSYEKVAERFGFTKRAIVKIARRERWQARLEKVEAEAKAKADKKKAESLADQKEQHLQALRLVLAKGVEGLMRLHLVEPADTLRAIGLAVRELRVELGEPSDRTEVSIDEKIRREYERWMIVEPDRPLANDFVSDEEFDRLLRAWFGNMARVIEPGRSLYIWGGYANLANYPPVLKACGLYFSQSIVWVKGHPVLTRKDFMGNFELAFYAWKEGAAHKFYGPANITDVWEVKKVNPQSMCHLTEKPVELARRAILYSSQRGEHVLDLFGGSGSTLIAADDTDRKAFLMELDPPYSDVIVTRWEKFTGKEAVLHGTDMTFAEVAQERKAVTA